jgi:mono/diheme cytochrome c family protein
MTIIMLGRSTTALLAASHWAVSRRRQHPRTGRGSEVQARHFSLRLGSMLHKAATPRASRLLLVALGIASAMPVIAADSRRGQQLFETHCIKCHSTELYKRAQPKVRSWPALLTEVRHWQTEAGQRWSTEEIDDVAAYLNRRFYKFERPAEVSLNP